MIQNHDIKPDFVKLQKYLNGGLSLQGFEELYFDQFEKNNPDFNKHDFEKFLSENDLLPYLSDLYIFSGWYADTWEGFCSMRDNFKKPHWKEQFNSDLGALKGFLKSNECLEIKFSSKSKSVTVQSTDLIDQLLGHFNTDQKEMFTPWLYSYDEYVKEARKLNFPEILILDKEQFEAGKINPFKKKASYRKEFVKSFASLFRYLRTETHFSNPKFQDTDIYGIIESLSLLLGCGELHMDLRKYIK